MNLQDKITSISKLGQRIKNLEEKEFLELAARVENNNNWFTPEQTGFALEVISGLLEEPVLNKWLRQYDIPEDILPKSVGLLMAGNIPAVGFHDFLCILLSGHEAHIKLGSSDKVLIPWMAGELIKIDPQFSSKIFFEDLLKGKDAYIATGSDNSSRYFDYYFGRFPSIIRKNRTSVGILEAKDDNADWQRLARDIFQYFGLGCRNVSKIYIQEIGQLKSFLDATEGFQIPLNHHKYLNNYDYNKAIYLINKEPHLDNGFLLVKESKDLVSPIAVLYYEIYSDLEDLNQKISSHSSKIQCMVSKNGWFPGSVDFGQAQMPQVSDYADHIDTMKFLTSL